jgi:DNA topoisomerase IA/ssDNA-binding Zn-finger/Zn-ribbon topoisomerase 1
MALKTMNSLYLNKIITYPRTESDIYKSNFDHVNLLRKFPKHSEYGSYSDKIISENRITPISRGKKDAGDHPPITPLLSLEKDDKMFENDLQKRVYDILARHYLAIFGNYALESKQKLCLKIREEPFTAKVVSLIEEGYLEIAPFLKPRYDTEIQISGNRIPINEIILDKKMTKPPPHYQDASLLKLMERNNLGTKSTRPQIIKILQNRELIYREKYRYLISDLGIFLIENLIKVWLPFLKPDFTKMVEERLNSIIIGAKTMNEVVTEIKSIFLKLFDKFLINKMKLKLEIEAHIKENPPVITSMSRRRETLTTANCPYCNKSKMKFIYLKNKRFLVCSDEKCKKYLSLPKKGRLQLLKSECKLCGFNIFKVSLRKSNKTFNYYLCPKCWNEGLKERSGKGFCSNCTQYKIINGKCVKI